MKQVTKQMIRNFKIMESGFDFMGYKVQRESDLSFHHLIISHKDSKRAGIGDGYVYWNGAILSKKTAHEYLHLIERVDKDMFYYITSEMVDINVKGYLDIYNLKNIRDILIQFEREHQFEKNKKGKNMIKEIYIRNRVII